MFYVYFYVLKFKNDNLKAIKFNTNSDVSKDKGGVENGIFE